MLNEKHITGLKGTFYGDREVVHAIKFEPDGTFKAISEAEVYLKELGYGVGSMCGDAPMGFVYEADYVAKWKNLSATERNTVDGIIIPEPEFREGGALILFFTPPRY